jgi:hypothetical protein
MKFKNEKNTDARILSIRDKEYGTLDVRVFTNGKGYAVCLTTGDYTTVGLSRAKALKLAWAIINELSPSYL